MKQPDMTGLWAGGIATAAVSALVATAGVLIARGVFDVPFLAPNAKGTFGDSTTFAYIGLAGAGAIVATFLLDVLVRITQAPLTLFTWIGGLGVALLVIAPFVTDVGLSSKIASALLNLAVGLVYLLLLPRIAVDSPAAGDGPPS